MLSSVHPVILLLLLLAYLFTFPLAILAKGRHPGSQITVVGMVYCDICSSNSFSKHSYFLPGVDVHIECKLRASSPRTTEDIIISVNRTTNRKGVYKLEIPAVAGINCADKLTVESFCQASLIHSSSSTCKVPGLRSSTSGLSIKSKQADHCVYNLNGLSYMPSKKNATICKNKEEFVGSLESSKCFLPLFSPFGSPTPQLPLPFPFQSPPSFPFPFQSPPSLPFPFLNPPPSLPFPFPNIPQIPPIPSLFSPPPPPAFNLRDPRTWIPNFPFPSPPPPPPPAFNLRDPRTWIPHLHPPPPSSP